MPVAQGSAPDRQGPAGRRHGRPDPRLRLLQYRLTEEHSVRECVEHMGLTQGSDELLDGVAELSTYTEGFVTALERVDLGRRKVSPT